MYLDHKYGGLQSDEQGLISYEDAFSRNKLHRFVPLVSQDLISPSRKSHLEPDLEKHIK